MWQPPCPSCSNLTCLGIKMFCKRLGYELGAIYQEQIIDNINENEKNNTSIGEGSVSENHDLDASTVESCLGDDAWPLCTENLNEKGNATTQSCNYGSIQRIKCMNSTSFIENRKSSC